MHQRSFCFVCVRVNASASARVCLSGCVTVRVFSSFLCRHLVDSFTLLFINNIFVELFLLMALLMLLLIFTKTHKFCDRISMDFSRILVTSQALQKFPSFLSFIDLSPSLFPSLSPIRAQPEISVCL